MTGEVTGNIVPEVQDDPAGEYVLGTLSPTENADAGRRLAIDPEFACAVAAWQQRLFPLLDAVPEAEAPEGVFYDIRQAIGVVSHDTFSVPEFSQQTLDVIRSDAAVKSQHRWRWIAIASSVIAINLAAIIVCRDVFYPQDSAMQMLTRMWSYLIGHWL